MRIVTITATSADVSAIHNGVQVDRVPLAGGLNMTLALSILLGRLRHYGYTHYRAITGDLVVI